MFGKQKGKESEIKEPKRELAFLSCNILIAACLLGMVGLSHVHSAQQEDVRKRRAELLVRSVFASLQDEATQEISTQK